MKPASSLLILVAHSKVMHSVEYSDFAMAATPYKNLHWERLNYLFINHNPKKSLKNVPLLRPFNGDMV
jgi:hypothetical protein